MLIRRTISIIDYLLDLLTLFWLRIFYEVLYEQKVTKNQNVKCF